MIRKIICLFFIAACINSFAQPMNNLILKGLDSCYSFKWYEGQKIFNDITDKYPNDPEGYFYNSSIYLWYYLGNQSKSDLDSFFYYSDKTINIANELLNKDKKNELAIYYLGASYNYRAVVNSYKQNYLEAAFSTKKSEDFLSALNPKSKYFYDAGLGLGLYNFAISQIPPQFQGIIKLVGIKGNKDDGYKYLYNSINKGVYTKIESSYFIAQLLENKDFDYNKSEELLNSLLLKYPENILFKYALSVIKFKKHELKDIPRLLNHTANQSSKFKKISNYSFLLLGDYYFRNCNYDSAIIYYDKYINENESDEYKSIALLRKSYSYYIKDDLINWKESLKKIQNYESQLEDDRFALRRCKIYLSGSLKINNKLLEAINLFEAGDNEKSLIILKEIIKTINEPDLLAEAYYYISEIYFVQKNYDESLHYAGLVRGQKIKYEEWLIPYSIYNESRVYRLRNDFFKAKDAYDEINSYSDYDYSDKLTNLSDKIIH